MSKEFYQFEGDIKKRRYKSWAFLPVFKLSKSTDVNVETGNNSLSNSEENPPKGSKQHLKH